MPGLRVFGGSRARPSGGKRPGAGQAQMDPELLPGAHQEPAVGP